MIDLHLSVARGSRNSAHLDARAFELLGDTEAVLKDALLGERGKRRELWMWLLSDAARLPVLPGTGKWSTFFTDLCLNPEARKKQQPACKRILQHLIDSRPDKVAELVFDFQPEAYAALFKVSMSDKIMLWFDHFAQDSLGNFQYGAKALAQYALREREQVWDLLVWSSAHAHAPVTVAAQPQLFSNLDVKASVRNLVRGSRDFWRSEEFRDSLHNGHLATIDPPFFTEELYSMLGKKGEGGCALEKLLQDLLARSGAAELVQQVVPLLTDEELLSCLSHALPRIYAGVRKGSLFQKAELALQMAIFTVPSFRNLDELLLFNALALRSGKVLRTIKQDTADEAVQGIAKKLEELHGSTTNQGWPDLLSDRSISRTRRMKAIILQLFASRFALEEAFCSGQEAIIATFKGNNVTYTDASVSGSPQMENVDTDSTSDVSRSGKSHKRSRSSKKRKKDSQLHKHGSKRKRKRQVSDSDEEDSNLEAFTVSPATARWQISFGPYSGDCTESDAAECLHMMTACIRMDMWWTLHA